ncbi:hypothetical protein SRO_5287 [Streptomyces rochei]|nr:hypothetical protein SRO_5287 [Streptomyces rochei]
MNATTRRYQTANAAALGDTPPDRRPAAPDRSASTDRSATTRGGVAIRASPMVMDHMGVA